jgi:hypothetical protein
VTEVRSGPPSARAHCSRSGSRSLSRPLASARGRPCLRLRGRPRLRLRPPLRSLPRSGSLWRPRPARQNAMQRPGKTPRTQRSLGSERGLATPSPDGKGEIPLGPSVKIMPVDSYSTLGRSCEPAFKWIRQPRPRPGPSPGRPQSRGQSRARAAWRCQALAGGWSALGGHEASCSFT